MSTSRILRRLAALGMIGMLSLSACTTVPGSRAPASSDAPAGQSLGSLMPAPPTEEVVGAGTVMDVDGRIELCLGAVAESYPPQCRGVPLQGWSWEGIEGVESSGDVRWGAYAVTGAFDGETFTVTAPAMLLALYDPPPAPDPSEGRTGETPEARLLAIQSLLPERLGDDGSFYLGSYPERGHLWVDVLWDDGTLQGAADDEFGADVVYLRSALRVIEG